MAISALIASSFPLYPVDFRKQSYLRRVWGIVRKGFKIALAQCHRVDPQANYRHLVILALTIAIV